MIMEYILFGTKHVESKRKYPDCTISDLGETITCLNVSVKNKCSDFHAELFPPERMVKLDHKLLTHGNETHIDLIVIYFLTRFINTEVDNRVSFYQLANNQTMMSVEHSYPFAYQQEQTVEHELKLANGMDESIPLLQLNIIDLPLSKYFEEHFEVNPKRLLFSEIPEEYPSLKPFVKRIRQYLGQTFFSFQKYDIPTCFDIENKNHLDFILSTRPAEKSFVMTNR